MSSWIQRLLGSLTGRSARTVKRKPPHRSRPTTTGRRCPRCGASLASKTTRCPQCGSRIEAHGAVRRNPLATPAPPRREPAPGPTLSEMEHRVLLAALRSEEGFVHVIRPDGVDAGEVKAGDVRIPGAEAVAAVESLLRSRLLRRVDETSCGLTIEGHTAASSLSDAE